MSISSEVSCLCVLSKMKIFETSASIDFLIIFFQISLSYNHLAEFPSVTDVTNVCETGEFESSVMNPSLRDSMAGALALQHILLWETLVYFTQKTQTAHIQTYIDSY